MSGRQITAYFLIVLIFLAGCSRKEEAVVKEQASPTELTLPQIPKLSLNYKPTSRDIQIALRNAGFYNGNVDGDIGEVTKKAIRAFQIEHGLKVDGKAGPKTWAVLEPYLYELKQ